MCDELNATITLSVDSSKLTEYGQCFMTSGNIVVNYTESAESIIDSILAGSSVTKGTKVVLETN